LNEAVGVPFRLLPWNNASPLAMLLPYVLQLTFVCIELTGCAATQMMKVACDTEQEYYIQQTVYQKLLGFNMAPPKCKGILLVDLAAELRQIKDELACGK
jgi:hypothetical protein